MNTREEPREGQQELAGFLRVRARWRFQLQVWKPPSDAPPWKHLERCLSNTDEDEAVKTVFPPAPTLTCEAHRSCLIRGGNTGRPSS